MTTKILSIFAMLGLFFALALTATAATPVSCGNDKFAAVEKTSVLLYHLGETTPQVLADNAFPADSITSFGCDAMGGFAVVNNAFWEIFYDGTIVPYPVSQVQFPDGNLKTLQLPVQLVDNPTIGSTDGRLVLAGTFQTAQTTTTQRLFIDPRAGNTVIGSQNPTDELSSVCPTANALATVGSSLLASQVFLDQPIGKQFLSKPFSVAPDGNQKIGCSSALTAMVFTNNGVPMMSTMTDNGAPFTATLGNDIGIPTSIAVTSDGVYFTSIQPGLTGTATLYRYADGVPTVYQQSLPMGTVVITVGGNLTVLSPTHTGWIVIPSGSL